MDPSLIYQDASSAPSTSHEPVYDTHDDQQPDGGVAPAALTAQPDATQAEPKPKPKPKKMEREAGKTLLPVARVQKILKADKEMSGCGKDALFLISVATEEFIKKLAQAGHQQAQRDKRTTVQQRDLATAVRSSQHEELSFLEEIIPPAISLSHALEMARQIDPNDLFSEPLFADSPVPPPPGKRKHKQRAKESERSEEGPKEKGKEKEKEKSREKRPRSSHPNGIETAPHGRASAQHPVAPTSLNGHGQHSPSHERPQTDSHRNHHAPFHASHSHQYRPEAPPHHHHHHHHHSSLHRQNPPHPLIPAHAGPSAPNGASYGYQHPPQLSPHYAMGPPPDMHGQYPSHSRSPVEQHYSHPQDMPMMAYQPLPPPPPGHYGDYQRHHAPPPPMDQHGAHPGYGYWYEHGPGPDPYGEPHHEYVEPGPHRPYEEGDPYRYSGPPQAPPAHRRRSHHTDPYAGAAEQALHNYRP